MADVSSPIAVLTDGIFTQVTAGLESGYGLRVDGALFSWGDNTYGQLGDDTYLQRNAPVSVVGGHKFNYIAAGWHHILGIKEDGTAWAWGDNETGQLGISEQTSREFNPDNWENVGTQALFLPSENPVSLNITVPPTSNGATYIPALGSDGTILAGHGEDFDIRVDFQLMQHPSTNSWIMSMEAAEYNTEVEMTAQRIYNGGDGYRAVWRKQNGGVVNFGSMTFRDDIFGKLRIERIGSQWTFYAWWLNDWHVIQTFASLEGPNAVRIRLEMRTLTGFPTAEGNFSNFSPTIESTEISTQPIQGDHEFVKVDAGECHSMGLKEDGSIWTWGCNEGGQLGYETFVGAIGAISQGAGKAIDQNGVLWSWGQNISGYLGDNTTIAKSSPISTLNTGGKPWMANTPGPINSVEQQGLTGPTSDPCTSIVPGLCRGIGRMGSNETWGIKDEGNRETSLWMWGDNFSGNLGNGLWNGGGESSPASVLGSGDRGFWTAQSGNHSCALDRFGALWCWGDTHNYPLQFGDIPQSFNSPVNVHSIIADQCGLLCLDQFVDIGVFRHLSMSNQNGILLSFFGQAFNWGSNGTAAGLMCQGVNGAGTQYGSPVVMPAGIGWPSSWIHAAQGEDNTIWISSQDGVTQASGVTNSGDVFMCGSNAPAHAMEGLKFGGGGPTGRSTPTVVENRPHNAIKVDIAHQSATFGFLRADGSLWMWGENNQGECGVGTFITVSSPTSVLGSGQSYNFIDFVIAGESGTVAIDEEGQVWGWGQWGHVGDHTTTDRSTPTKVSLPAITPEAFRTSPTRVGTVEVGYTDIAAGNQHNLALKPDGSAWAWGSNVSGQLGNNTTVDVGAPISVVGGLSYIDIAAGIDFSMALQEDGTKFAWGDNTCGKLGDGTTTDKSSPVSTWEFTLSGISAGGQGYGGAINDGNLWMWGQGVNGVLGINSIANRSSPVTVVGPQGWGFYDGEPTPIIQAAQQIPGGAEGIGMFSDNVTWATKTDGSLWMWGDATNGNLGTGQFETNYSSPRSVLGGIQFLFVGSTPGGPASTYALDINGDIWVWGSTNYILQGGVGGAASSYNSPVKVENFIFTANPAAPFLSAKFHVLSAGTFGGMALNATTAWVWGSNSGGFQGKLCTGDLVNQGSPVAIAGAWTHLAHGNGNSLLLDTFGNVWGCGANGGGLSGWGPGGTYESNPTAILGGPHSAIKVAAGNAAQVFGFLREDGSLWMWGDNSFGMLGVGDTTNRTSPTSVLGSGDLYRFVDFVVGGQSGTVAIDDTGQVWGWGHWSSVGDNTTTNRSSPTKTSLTFIGVP